MQEAGISVPDTPVSSLSIEGDHIAAWHMQDGAEHHFDTVYSALGTRIRSSLATDLGADTDADGALIVDRQQQTSVPGLYTAGDVVSGLSQISVASGHATIAATHINASLPFPRPERQDGHSRSISPAPAFTRNVFLSAARRASNPYPLDLLERDFVAGAIIRVGCNCPAYVALHHDGAWAATEWSGDGADGMPRPALWTPRSSIGNSTHKFRTLMQAGPAKANELFTRLAETSGTAVRTRERLFAELKGELEAHTDLEEQHLFPVLRKHAEAKELVAGAIRDNKELRAALADLDVLPKNDETFLAKLAELRRTFRQHARDERRSSCRRFRRR